MYEYTDHLGRCERLGEIVPETELTELTEITADNGVKLLLCADCLADVSVGIVK